MSKPKTVAAPLKVTGKLVEEYLAITAELTEIVRGCDAKKRRAKMIEDAMEQCVRAEGGKKREVKKGKRLLRLVSKPGSVCWKDAYIAVAGEEAATDLQAAAPEKEKLEIV